MFDRKEYLKEYYKANAEHIKEYGKEYYIKNRDKVLEKNKNYHKNNPEKERERYKQYRKNNREKINQYLKNRRKIDLKFNLNDKISALIRQSIKDNKSGWNWEKLVGYTLKDLVERLKETIPENYCWQDYLDGKLQIDHKIPKSAFNFNKPEHIDFKRCWTLNNLRLLPVGENRIKYKRLKKPFQPSLKI